MSVHFLKKLLPVRWKHAWKQALLASLDDDLRSLAREEGRGEGEALLREHGLPRPAVVGDLYQGWQRPVKNGSYFFDASDLAAERTGEGLPVPPGGLRMGYYEDDSEAAYLESGKDAADRLRAVYTANGGAFGAGTRVLDWGCASGRVLRHFAVEAGAGEFWGADQDERYVCWDKENLSPPFRFVTCSAYPHLPFEDNTFDFIYGISVFTHVVDLADAWLMELRRITKPRGLVLLTVHTEASLDFFETEYWPYWLDRETPLDEFRKHDMAVLAGPDWGSTFPFFRESYLRREWGRYFDIADIRPAFAQFGQTVVLLRKP